MWKEGGDERDDSDDDEEDKDEDKDDSMAARLWSLATEVAAAMGDGDGSHRFRL